MIDLIGIIITAILILGMLSPIYIVYKIWNS
jgi:hypothetical protein